MTALNSIRILGLLGLILFAKFSGHAQDKALSSLKVSFRIKNAGIGVDGSFTKATGYTDLQKDNPAASRFRGEVEAASIETGIGLRNQHLRKAEYFDATKYPVLRMQSVEVQWVQGKYLVSWDISMKGQTRRVKSEVDVISQGDTFLLQTEMTINRRDWKIGGASLTMADQVRLRLQATFKP